MNKLNISTIRQLTKQEIELEIVKIKKILFNLRLQKSTNQLSKPHLFKYNKRILAQLYTIKNIKNY
uniref:Large ribosomal subunit protein uL29c n=1 Tax=Compsopogon caeruleus TaxID=31354 RepID=A0A1Z1XB54_9RHOD|nr:50S ribosomal protein L29 [Compsopogon caeruleus]ARX96085.1 50S ribosomal protein L29 [Compsopogon caeruleus]